MCVCVCVCVQRRGGRTDATDYPDVATEGLQVVEELSSTLGLGGEEGLEGGGAGLCGCVGV